MKPNTKPLLKKAPCIVTYKNGKKQLQIEIANTKITDWVDKQELRQHLHISDRTLQTLRSRKQIPYSCIGGKILYYLPGILALLEQNVFY